jgi:hypothetical protein
MTSDWRADRAAVEDEIDSDKAAASRFLSSRALLARNNTDLNLVSLSSNNDARSVACSKAREMTERTMNSIQW